MTRKKTICFIGQNERTCAYISAQLEQFLSDYIDVRTWCLNNSNSAPAEFSSDIYITSTKTVLEKVKHQLPADKIILVAARTINIDYLDKLFAIEPGSRTLVVGSSEETADMAIDIIKSFGIHSLELIPYYPGIPTPPPGDVKVAISTGLNHVVPEFIERTIDVGVKGIDISTFVELTQHLKVSKEVLNDISHYYIEAILNVSLRLHHVARNNESLKRGLEVILSTTAEAIIATNETGEIVLINPAAEKLLGIDGTSVVRQPLNTVLPQIDIAACLNQGDSIIHDIEKVNENYYIFSANPITEPTGAISGAVITIRPVVEVQELETKVRRTLGRKGNHARHHFNDVVGESAALKKVLDVAKKFAKTDLTVLLEGESGTGKELFAQAIHNSSLRRQGPFVALNFAALPENLVESELFGYEDGAFTGAKKGGKIGLFEEAHRGTIFLDEIGDASLGVQKRLLRVLEEREVRRLGGGIVTPIDIRIIAATNQSLETLVEKGTFRSDLYYRLCTLPILIPPLREREGDIILLLNFFSARLYNRKLQLAPALEELLLKYRWPGNIRELQNLVKYICSVLPQHATATLEETPTYLRKFQFSDRQEDQIPTVFTNRPQYEKALREIENEDALELVCAILTVLRDSSTINKGLGRQSLMKKLKESNHRHSEHRIRLWLKKLDKTGYVLSGSTRQGSKITASGEELLRCIANSSPGV